jgi:hypothetical protein
MRSIPCLRGTSLIRTLPAIATECAEPGLRDAGEPLQAALNYRRAVTDIPHIPSGTTDSLRGYVLAVDWPLRRPSCSGGRSSGGVSGCQQLELGLFDDRRAGRCLPANGTISPISWRRPLRSRRLHRPRLSTAAPSRASSLPICKCR